MSKISSDDNLFYFGRKNEPIKKSEFEIILGSPGHPQHGQHSREYYCLTPSPVLNWLLGIILSDSDNV